MSVRLSNSIVRTCPTQIHFDIVRQTDVADHPEAYGEIADAYFDKKLWTDALDVFYDLSEFDEVSTRWRLPPPANHLKNLPVG